MTEDGISVPALWRELGRIREDQGLSYEQLRIKIAHAGTDISKQTLSDRLRQGRRTSWGDMQPVVIALGRDESEWKERFDRAQERAGEPGGEPPGSVEKTPARRWWTGRRARIVMGLVVAGLVCLAALFGWPGWIGRSTQQQEVGCVRVSSGAVRVYDVPGSRKHSFLKYEGERIQVLTPPQEVIGTDGLPYRRVLTPSRRDGYGWIPNDTTNVTHRC